MITKHDEYLARVRIQRAQRELGFDLGHSLTDLLCDNLWWLTIAECTTLARMYSWMTEPRITAAQRRAFARQGVRVS
jgi:hypothetical protein